MRAARSGAASLQLQHSPAPAHPGSSPFAHNLAAPRSEPQRCALSHSRTIALLTLARCSPDPPSAPQTILPAAASTPPARNWARRTTTPKAREATSRSIPLLASLPYDTGASWVREKRCLRVKAGENGTVLTGVTAVGFGAPFAIAGEYYKRLSYCTSARLTQRQSGKRRRMAEWCDTAAGVGGGLRGSTR